MASTQKLAVITGGKGRVPSNQLSLFEKPSTVVPLEEIAGKPTPPINNFVNYNITFEELASFQSKPTERVRNENYYGIKHAWYGINNMESFNGLYGIPHEMLVRLKPFEIIALYISIAQVKQADAISGGKDVRCNRMIATEEKNFGFLINELGSMARDYHGINVMANKKSNKEIQAPSLRDRMQSVSSASKKKFMRSLKIPYRRPGNTNRQLTYEFRDPHPEDISDSTGINIYRSHIAEFIKAEYENNTKQFR